MTRPVLVLSGSMSPLTARQIDVASSYLRIPIPVTDLLDSSPQVRAAIVGRIKQSLQMGSNVLAHLVHPENQSFTEQVIDPTELARATGSLLTALLLKWRPARLGLSGGDTSSHAILSLDVWGLTYIGQVDPGVALCRLRSTQASLDGLDVMLKGGQMGSLGVFEKLVNVADACLKA